MQPDRREEGEGATVRRLLAAATQEFAKHGFAAARIRDIVEAAGANLAAVNYHFGGKEELYQATVALLLRRAREELPPASPQLRILPPEERLHAIARSMVLRHLGDDPLTPVSRIIAHEILDPTPLLGTVLREATFPQWAPLRDVVAEMLGPRATDEDVALACICIAGQWLFIPFGRRILDHRFPDSAADPAMEERLADHFASVAVAAIREKRRLLDAPQAETPGLSSGLPAPEAGVSSGKAPARRRSSKPQRRSRAR